MKEEFSRDMSEVLSANRKINSCFNRLMAEFFSVEVTLSLWMP